MADKKTRYVVSVLIPDRVGILKAMTSAITDRGGNIDGISQTVVQGYFTVILTATFDQAVGADAIRCAIARNLEQGEAEITVREFSGAMHKRPRVNGDRYILTVTGKEQKGILKCVTGFLADKGINVEDLFFEIRGPLVTHVGELTVPGRLDIKQIQDELRELLSTMELTATMQHENLFRATNEVGPLSRLLREKSDAPNR